MRNFKNCSFLFISNYTQIPVYIVAATSILYGFAKHILMRSVHAPQDNLKSYHALKRPAVAAFSRFQPDSFIHLFFYDDFVLFLFCRKIDLEQ